MDQNRFTVGLVLFLTGIVWNVYYTALAFQQPFGSPYANYLEAGGAIITIGLLTMVMTWPGRGRGPGSRRQ